MTIVDGLRRKIFLDSYYMTYSIGSKLGVAMSNDKSIYVTHLIEFFKLTLSIANH